MFSLRFGCEFSSCILVLEGILFANNCCVPVRSDLLLHDWAHRQSLDGHRGNLDLGLHQVLWELVPHSVMPLTLNGLLVNSEVFSAIVLDGALAKLFANLVEPKEHLVTGHILEGLLLDVAVNVGARHVGVVVATHGNL